MNAWNLMEAVNSLEETTLAETLKEPKGPSVSESRQKLRKWITAAACLLITVLAAACAAKTAPTEDEKARLIELNIRQSRPTRLYHLIEQSMQSMGYDLIGDENYPEDYGGYYVSDDRETLCLCLVSPTEESIRKYLSLLTEEAAAYVKIVPVRYSRSELQAMVREVFEAAAESKAEVYMGGPDDRINGLNFGGSEEGLAWVREYMRQHYPDVPLQTEICGPIVFT